MNTSPYSILRLSKALINRSPRENFLTVLKKLKRQSTSLVYHEKYVLASSKHMDSAKLIDRLFRYQRVIGNAICWDYIDFRDKKVIEIGSGPLLGWGPIAIFLGCERYVCVEPDFNESLLRSESVWKRYFLYVHSQLKAIYGEIMSYDEFKMSIMEKVDIYTTKFQYIPLNAGFCDIMLSNSVLEHIVNVEELFSRMALVCSEKCIHLHAIDFGNHRSTDDPFEGVYNYSRDEYRKRYPNSQLNLLKPSEFVDMFRRVGIKTQIVVYHKWREIPHGEVVPYWRKYSKEDLSTLVAFVVSSNGCGAGEYRDTGFMGRRSGS